MLEHNYQYNSQKTLNKFRLGNHRLQETGSHSRESSRNLLVCPFCHLNKVEHKLHLLFNCNLHDSLRSNFYRNISNGYPLFNNFDNNGKTLFISDNVDLHIYRLTAAYIHSCMEYRQKIVL